MRLEALHSKWHLRNMMMMMVMMLGLRLLEGKGHQRVWTHGALGRHCAGT